MFQLFLRARVYNFLRSQSNNREFKTRLADRDAETDRVRIASIMAAIQTALRLRPEAGEGHLALAAHRYTKLDYDGARQELAVAGRALPNEPLVFELTGYMDRRQNRWEECVANLERALNLDPNNFFILQQIALACDDPRCACHRPKARATHCPAHRQRCGTACH